MSFKHCDKINNLSNKQLIELLKDNNYQFEEVLTAHAITGKQFLELKEVDMIKWKLSSNDKKKLWCCVTELNKNPATFFSSKPTTLEVKQIKQKSFKNNNNNNVCDKLEHIFSKKLANQSSTQAKLISDGQNGSVSPSDYVAVIETHCPASKLCDKDGYLIPDIKRFTKIIHEDYESSPFQETGAGMLQRKPTPLPRPTTTDRGYICGPITSKLSSNNERVFLKFPIADAKKVENQFQQKMPLIDLPTPDEEFISSDEGWLHYDSSPIESGLQIVPNNLRKSISENNLSSNISAPKHKTDIREYIQFAQSFDDLTYQKNLTKQLPVPDISKNNLENNVDLLLRDPVCNNPFFWNTDRKGARHLLHDLPDGAFLLRKSSRYYIGLVIKYDNKIINLGIRKTADNKLILGENSNNLPEFDDINHLIDFFTENPIGFKLKSGQIVETFLKKVLPHSFF